MVEKQTDILKVQLKDVRLSFPALFKAKPFGGSDAGEPAFSAEFLIPKDTKLGEKLIDQIYDAIEEAKYGKWGDDPDKWPKISRDKPFFKDGDDRDYRRDETEGMMIVSARNLKKPRVLGIDKEDIFEADGIIYGGCYVDAIVRIWAQDNKYGKRINCSLEAVRFRRDGDPFGAAPINPDEFEDIEDDGRSRRGRTIEGTARRVNRDEDDDRGSSRGRPALEDRRGRDRDDEGDRGSSRGRGRDEDEDRGSRRGRDDDDRGSRRGKDDDDAGERGGRRGAERADDDDRGSRRGRDDSEDRGRDRGRGGDDDRGSSRGRGRDDDDDRGARRSRDDDRDGERGSSRARDDDGDRGTRRSSRDDDEDRPSRNSRSSGRRRDEGDDI